ncbi:MAG: IS66-like element accessory protein TnpA [Rhodoferax sp.]
MQKNSEVLSGLVVGHKSDGRCRYDPQAKQELIRQCMKPGVSVARMAMQHGVNANLLRTWITKVQSAMAKQMVASEVSEQVAQAFVPVRLEPPSSANPPAVKVARLANKAPLTLVRMQVRLPNGVSIDLDQAPMHELGEVMQMLSVLPCLS